MFYYHLSILGDVEEVKRLINSGVNVNAVDKDEFTALHQAAFEGK